jgi:ASC-1-like (ASCH) protein
MKHDMKLQSIYFDKIKKGQKIYEIRLNDEKRRIIDVGDVIIFKREPELKESIETIVEDLIYFDSFKEMIDTLPLFKVGFENVSKKEVEDIYHSFYSVENESKYGVVAIKVKLI